MLKTTLDYSIFQDFVDNEPKNLLLGDTEENEIYYSFWKYLKGGTDLTIVNNNDSENIFLNNLTTGRKGTKLEINDSYKKPHKCIFPKNTDVRSVYFLNETDEKDIKTYKEKNGFFFGFLSDYKNRWKDLSLLSLPQVLTVDVVQKQGLKSWTDLKPYLTPFTDLVLVDNYILDDHLWDYNLFEIIRQFKTATNIKFNLLIVSFIGDKFQTDIKSVFEKINNFLISEQISCNLSIALAPREIKLHDRGIYTNYLKISSGDSFNYFDSKGNLITKGTEMSIFSLCENDKYTASENSLFKISKTIEKLKKKTDKEKYLIGDLKNKLLSSHKI